MASTHLVVVGRVDICPIEHWHTSGHSDGALRELLVDHAELQRVQSTVVGENK